MICSRPDGLMFPLGGTANDAWQKFGLHVTRERFYTSVTTSQALHCYSSFTSRLQSENVYLCKWIAEIQKETGSVHPDGTQWTCGPHK